MIDFENPDTRIAVRIAPRKRIQPRPQSDVLFDSAPDRFGKFIFRKPAAHRHESTHCPGERMALALRIPAYFGCGVWRQNADRERVFEDQRVIQHLMGRPAHRNPQRRPAVHLLLHKPILLIQIPGKRVKPFRSPVRQ